MLSALKHPVYKQFSEKLAVTDHVAAFWNVIDEQLASWNRNKMLVAIELAIFILRNVTDVAVVRLKIN